MIREDRTANFVTRAIMDWLYGRARGGEIKIKLMVKDESWERAVMVDMIIPVVPWMVEFRARVAEAIARIPLDEQPPRWAEDKP